MKQVETFLAQSSEHMDKALSGSRVVITCQDTELRYLWLFNPAQEFKNVIGKKASEFLSKAQYEPVDALKRKVLKSGRPRQEIIKVPYQGAIRTYEMTVTPTFNEDKVIGVTTISVDLTELLRAQEELHQANARLLGLLGDGVQTGKTLIRSISTAP
jgi:transcriptional regulator with PAS, ATPase and Fis domain